MERTPGVKVVGTGTNPVQRARCAPPRHAGDGRRLPAGRARVVSDLQHLPGADQRLEAGIVLQRTPPPVHALSEPLTVPGVSDEVLLQQLERLILVAEL